MTERTCGLRGWTPRPATGHCHFFPLNVSHKLLERGPTGPARRGLVQLQALGAEAGDYCHLGRGGGYWLWGAGAVRNRIGWRSLPAATGDKHLAGGFGYEIWKRANRFLGARRWSLSREKPGVPSDSAAIRIRTLAGSGDPPSPTPLFPAGSGIWGHGEASQCSRAPGPGQPRSDLLLSPCVTQLLNPAAAGLRVPSRCTCPHATSRDKGHPQGWTLLPQGSSETQGPCGLQWVPAGATLKGGGAT